MKILHQQANKSALLFFQRGVFGLWLAIIVWDPLQHLAKYQYLSYIPTGFLLKMFPEHLKFLPVRYPFLLGLKIALIVVLVLLLLNRFKKIAGLAACILLSLYQGIVRSFGHINHPEVMLMNAVFVLTLYFFFEDSLEKKGYLDQNRQITVYSIPLIVFLFFFGCSYAFAGIHRIIFGGLDVFTNESIIHWVVENGSRSRLINFHLEWVILKYPFVEFLMRAGLPIVTLAEISAPFCMISKPLRYFFLLIIVPFHIIVALFMGIMFWENFCLFILFINFTPFFEHKEQPDSKLSSDFS